MQKMAVWGLLVLYLLWACCSPVTSLFISPTTEVSGRIRADKFCADPAVELLYHQPFDFDFYARKPLQQKSSPAMASIYQAPLVLPSKLLSEGLSNIGDNRRLERTLWKLIKGQPITAVLLGGSITAGTGLTALENSWGSRFFHWVQATFPHQQHRLVNEAMPAVSSAYIAPCVEALVPGNTDLVIMEFSFNDYERANSFEFDDISRRGMERLVRKLLRMKGAPALMYMHYHLFPQYRSYWEGAEGHIDTLMKYYGVPTLSMRNALHTLLDAQPALMDQLWRPLGDRLHPSCVGAKFMADQVIGYFQDMAAYVLETCAHLPEPPHPEVQQEVLRRAVLPGNAAEKPEICLLDDHFKALAVGGHGWEWVEEGPHMNRPTSWGWVSTQTGAQLILKVPLAGLSFPDNKLVIALGASETHEHMGYARVDCISGCTCAPREINMLLPFRASLTYWKPQFVTLAPGSQECTIALTNIPKTKSKEHKVKFVSAFISGELGFIESWTWCKDCLG